MQGLAQPLHPAKAQGALPHTFGKEKCGLLLRKDCQNGKPMNHTKSAFQSQWNRLVNRASIDDQLNLD